MAADPEKPRNQTPPMGSEPVQWQTPENRDQVRDQIDDRSTPAHDVETDKPSRSDASF